jgi:hypothetical protein
MPGINDLKDAQALVGSFNGPDFSGIPDEGAEQPDFSGIPDAPEMTFSRAMGSLYYPARQMVGAHATTIKSYRAFVAKDQTVESMSEPLDPFAEDYAKAKGEKPTATVFDTEFARMPIEAKIRVNTRVDELREQGMPESTARKQATFDEIKAQQARINSDLTAVEAATRLPEEFKASSGVAEDLLKGLSSVAVSIPTYIVGGPFVAFMSNYSQMHGIKVQELDDLGVEDPAARLQAGMVSGAMQAPLETLSDVFMLSRWMKANGTWTGALMRIAEGAVGEGVTEYAQQYPDEFATLLALNPDVSLMDISRHMDAHASDIRADAAYAGFIGAMVGGVTTGAGVSVATIAQRMLTPQQKAINEQRAARIDYLANKENLTAEDEAELRADLGLAADTDVKDIIRQVKKQFELDKPIESEARDKAFAFHQEKIGSDAAAQTIAITDAIARSVAEKHGMKPAAVYDMLPLFEGDAQAVEVGTEAALFQAANTNTENFKNWFRESKVTSEDGKPLQVFHGTKRPDRIGDRFQKSRATSGPMAFFTDDADIASKYGMGKEDTSLVVDSLEQFFFIPDAKGKPKAKGLKQIWWNLTPEQKQSLREKLSKIGTNEETGEVELTEDGGLYPGGWDYEVRRNGGNWLMAANEIWLLSGAIYGQEEQFTKVLKLAGIDGVEYDDPYAQKSAVIPVFLSIQNPLVTSEIPQSVIDALEKKSRRVRHNPEKATGGDTWDKNLREPRSWMEELKKDHSEGKNSFVWTSIPDWVTKVLKEFGYDGIRDTGGKMGGQGHDVWIPFEENQVKSSIGNRGTYDPKSKSILRQDARGQIENALSGPNIQKIIRHFEGSDPSTTIHELGHFITALLWETGDSDYLTLAEFAGVDSERALAGVASWTREEHERTAKAFEAYLMEGRAPSQRLQIAFQKMKEWLLNIYKSITSLGVELDDNVRGVFDRMLTTEIERAENPILEVREWFNVDETVKGELARRALDTERAVGMEYDEVVAAARTMAIADKKKKKQKAEKKIRAEMMKEAQKSIEDDPFYAMVEEMMGNGGMKASVIEDLYDSATIGELNRRRPGIVAKDGFHPDVVGMQYGYHSIDDIVQDILNKPTKKEAVQSYFDGLWAEYERFEHLNWAETYGEAIDAEIAMVSKLLGKENKPKPAKGIKTVIGKITGVIKTDELKKLAEDMKRDAKIAREAWNAARKAMREVEVADLKDEAKAKLEDQKQAALEKLLAVKEDHQSRMDELKLQYQERHRVQTYQRKIKKILKNKGLSIDARSQIAAFLSDYMDIPPKYRGEAPAMTLQEYVESKRETEGDYVVDWLLEEYADRPPANQRNAKGYRVPLSSDGLDPIWRVVAMIAHMDLGDRKLQAMQAKLEHERDVAGKVKRIHEVWGQPDDPEHPLDIITKRDRIAWFANLSEGSKRFGAELMKCEFIFDALDGWQVRGPNGELFGKIARAENAELLLGAEISGRVTRAFDSVAGKNVNAWAQKLHQVPGVSITDRATGKVSRLLTKEQMIAIALNSGNEGNLTAMREGNGLTDEQINAVWAALSPGEQGLVREIWATINTLFPQLDAVHRRLTGVPLKKVDGDYYPMVFSRTLSENAAKYAEREASKDLTYTTQTYHRPSVSAGHRKTRKGGKLGLDLSLGVISKHIVQTVHDITHSVPVREVQKVVADPAWRAAVVSSVGEPFYQQLMPWLSNVARPMHDEGGNFAAKARKASTLVALGLRVTTMLQQWTAIFPTIGREGLLPTLQAIGKFYSSPIQMANFVNEVDPKMKFRKDSFSQELAIFRDRFGKKFFGGHNAIINASFYMIEMFDAMVRYPTWVVGYQNAMKETGGNHVAAVEAASKTVAKTQGWGSEKDLAMWQRGGKTRSEYKKLFYMFSTYFNLFANQLWETQARWRLGNISTAKAAQQYMWTMIFPAMIGGILQRWRLPEGGEWLTDQIRYLLAGVPVVRDVANGMLNLFVGGGPVDYQMSPVERIPNKMLQVAQHLASDKPDATRKAAMDALELSGYAFRLPTGQLSVTMDGVFDLMNGQGTVAGLLKRPERPKSKNVRPSM